MHCFRAPNENLGTLAGSTAAELLGAAADLALVLDGRGVIRDISFGNEELTNLGLQRWVGIRWEDTVAPDSTLKIKDLLGANEADKTRQRQVNHVLDDGSNLLVLYSTVELEDRGLRIAVGKDLSSLERIQQKLVNVQHSMQRDYATLKQYETRYRLLFQTATEAILIANVETGRVIEANPAASELLKKPSKKLSSSSLLACFPEPHHRDQMQAAVQKVQASSQPVKLLLSSESDQEDLLVNLSLFRIDMTTHVLVRLQSKGSQVQVLDRAEHSVAQLRRLATVVENAPDAFVITDKQGIILTANSEFLDMAQLAGAQLAEGEKLSRWLGLVGVDIQVIMNSVNEHGSIRLYRTEVRGEYGTTAAVEVSAVSAETDDVSCIGFSIRNISRRMVAANDASATAQPRTVDQLTDLVGRVPLKELVRESTEVIEQLCIQAALKATGNNRASAAEILGLSRQSLYVKLRRYSMDEGDSEPE